MCQAGQALASFFVKRSLSALLFYNAVSSNACAIIPTGKSEWQITMTKLLIRAMRPEDCTWVHRLLTDRWSDSFMITRGKVHYPAQEHGFIAEMDHNQVGLVTFAVQNGECEILTLDSLRQGIGIGTALLDSVVSTATESGWQRVWLITTNDNLNALGFYQKTGLPSGHGLSWRCQPDQAQQTRYPFDRRKRNPPAG